MWIMTAGGRYRPSHGSKLVRFWGVDCWLPGWMISGRFPPFTIVYSGILVSTFIQSCAPGCDMVGYSHPTIGSLKAEVKMPKKLWPGWKTMFRATTAGIPSNPGDLDGVSTARNQAWEQAIPLAHSFQATSHDPGIWLGFSSSPFQPWWQRQGQECWVSQPIAQCHSISFQHISDQGWTKDCRNGIRSSTLHNSVNETDTILDVWTLRVPSVRNGTGKEEERSIGMIPNWM